MMKLKEATKEQEKALTMALSHLRRARALLLEADCPASHKKARSAVKSAEGAERHMQRRRSATKEAMLEEGRRAVAEEEALHKASGYPNAKGLECPVFELERWAAEGGFHVEERFSLAAPERLYESSPACSEAIDFVMGRGRGDL